MNEPVLRGRLLRHGPVLADDEAHAEIISLIAAARQPMGDRDQRNYLGIRVVIRKHRPIPKKKK